MLPSSSEGLRAFDQVLLDSCLLVRPPEKLSAADWTDKYAFLSPEGSAQPGKVYISNAEYQREPLESLSDPRFQTIVLDWPSQVGKTQIGLWYCGYRIEHDPCPILFMEPDENLAKTVAKDRIDPMIRDTPVLKKLFRDARSKNSGNDTLHKTFPGGHLTLAWASSSSQTASRPIGALITDEESRPGYDQNKEGDAIGQARKRLATFPNRKHLRISSPALERTCKITKAFINSDQRRFYVACPQCGTLQTLRWEGLHWPPGDPSACYYVCEANGCEIRHDDKFAMIRAGKWVAENPGGGDGRTAGYHINALYSTIGYTWTELIADFIECAGIPDKLQVFRNTVLALPWDEEAEGVDLTAVQKHAEDYPCQAPDWVLMVTCGADVQKDRIEGTKWGFGLSDQSGVIEHRIFRGDPIRDPTVWQRFESWRRERVQHESGLVLPTVCTFVDSGDGNRTQAVYEYTRRHEAQQVFACKGSSLNGAPLVNRGNRVGKFRTIVVSVGTSTAKDTIYGRLQIEDREAAGYIHFPSNPEAGCDGDYFKHLTAERLVTRQTKGGEISRWENPNKRNEALDTAVYAMAAKEFTRANLRELDRKMKAKIERVKPIPPTSPASAADRIIAATAVALAKALAPERVAEAVQKQAKVGQNLKKRRKIPGYDFIRG